MKSNTIITYYFILVTVRYIVLFLLLLLKPTQLLLKQKSVPTYVINMFCSIKITNNPPIENKISHWRLILFFVKIYIDRGT